MRKIILLTALTVFAVSCESKHETKPDNAGGLTDVKAVNDKDPVCGMSTAVHMKDTLSYEGRLYGFCSSNCKDEFKKDPKKYVKNN